MKHVAFVIFALIVAYGLSVIIAEPGSDAQYIVAGAFGLGIIYIYGMLSVSFWARRKAKENPEQELPGLGRAPSRVAHTPLDKRKGEGA